MWSRHDWAWRRSTAWTRSMAARVSCSSGWFEDDSSWSSCDSSEARSAIRYGVDGIPFGGCCCLSDERMVSIWSATSGDSSNAFAGGGDDDGGGGGGRAAFGSAAVDRAASKVDAGMTTVTASRSEATGGSAARCTRVVQRPAHVASQSRSHVRL